MFEEFEIKFCPDLFWEITKKVPPRTSETTDKVMTITEVLEILGIIKIYILQFNQ
jgi:hypothetical protein